MGPNKFVSSMVLFKDTRGAERITVRNIEIECDEHGLFEGPGDLAKDIEPHGFVPASIWFNDLTPVDKVRYAKLYPQHFERLVSRMDREIAKADAEAKSKAKATA